METSNESEELNSVDRSNGGYNEIIREELIMQDLILYGSSVSPFLPPWKSTEQEQNTPDELITKPMVGPTKIKMPTSCSNGSQLEGYSSYRSPMIALPEKGLSAKMEGKYTLRIKTCGIGVADDGYKWRKYGQKSIKNSPNPRSYYRCTNPKCNAKRQVERSTEDPNMLIITYEGLHLHYTYSHLFHSQPHDLSVTKKPKTNSLAWQPHHILNQDQPMQSTVLQLPLITGDSQQNTFLDVQKFQNSAMRDEIMQEEALYDNNNNNKEHCSQGLLEDIVPLMVRKPCSPGESSNEPSCPSQASSPSYSSSLCWTPETFHFAEGVLSSMV
ncbi:probable WRKY transcription factor 49 [Phalaenopsis equestris]|uniref:probable WRKY transcription factor 49 n=1 Tax=Phalaenopsis equestris TaxID=78828 RepID=UPI0009E18D14|nr:probable WRKY transcription factor 49 [Phalaenopsis equestris]